MQKQDEDGVQSRLVPFEKFYGRKITVPSLLEVEVELSVFHFPNAATSNITNAMRE